MDLETVSIKMTNTGFLKLRECFSNGGSTFTHLLASNQIRVAFYFREEACIALTKVGSAKEHSYELEG